GIRIERLQDIGEADALAEGMPSGDDFPCETAVWRNGFPCPSCSGQGVHGALAGSGGWMEVDCDTCGTPGKRFQLLWSSVYGSDNWEANPWVWVIEFKRVDE